MDKRKVLIGISIATALLVTIFAVYFLSKNHQRQLFVSNLKGVVTDTLTFPWEQWPDIVQNLDPVRPEAMRTAMEDYFTAKYGDRLTQSAVKSLVDNSLLLCAWNVWGEGNVVVKSIQIEEWLPKSKVCLFSVVLSTGSKEYTLSGKAQMAAEGSDQLSYCNFSGDGFNEFIDAAKMKK